ncbi:MAG: hypothetical protein COB41_03540 [Proteobacteria bacterium]|nr:MAG: hypothetical protein COB41_03540 [Pseudomonadota bacterium]
MAKSLVSLMQVYAEALTKLADKQGKSILEQMARIAIASKYHHLYIHPFEQSILPQELHLPQAEYILDKFCARFSASLSLAKYKCRNICNAHLDVHFDFANLTKQGDQQPLPCYITMHLDEITQRTEYTFWVSVETLPHDIYFTESISLQLSEQDIVESQHTIQPWYTDLPSFEVRSQAFKDLLLPDLPIPEPIDPKQPLRFICACCGFPTQLSIDDYKCCDLCDWVEDKMGYNITAELFFARKQFELLGFITWSFPEPEQSIEPHIMEANHKLVLAYLALLTVDKQHPDFDKLWQTIVRCEHAIGQ